MAKTNESATVPKTFHFSELNEALSEVHKRTMYVRTRACQASDADLYDVEYGYRAGSEPIECSVMQAEAALAPYRPECC